MMHPNVEAAKKANACIEGIEFLEENSELSLEQLLKLDADNGTGYMRWYLRSVMKGERWLEAEHIIAKIPACAYSYARDIIKGRWSEGEPAIMSNAFTAYRYSEVILRRRWIEAEPVIQKDHYNWRWYTRDVINA